MKKIFIGLFIMILFYDTGKAFAVNRAVVSYVISNVWYDDIFLIVDKSDSMAYKNFTVQVGDGGGHEELYEFPNWYNDIFSPELFYNDINGDGLKDIIVVLISGSGVSLSTKEIHVLNQVKDPYKRFEEVPVESISDAVKRFIKLEQKDNKITILIGKKKHIVDYSKFGYYTRVDTPAFGSIEKYEPKGGTLYGSTNVYITIPEAYIGSISVKYAWNGKTYKAESVSFEAKPYELSKED
jgi:hypothetical protein